MVSALRAGFFLILAVVVTGCAQNYYNIPRETYEQKVRVLGVAPIMLDADSDVRHPERGEVLRIVRDANRRNEKELVDMLKDSGEYFTVRFLDDEAEQLFAGVVSRRERRDDAGVVYNKYFYKPEEIKKYCARQNVDAVLLVTVSGISMREKIYSNTMTAYLDENYNNLILTAQILDPDGALLWEYPNFRQHFITYPKLFALQYPDFEEARANLTDQVKVKYKSIAGIERAFTKSESVSFTSSRKIAVLYKEQFADMTSYLRYWRNPFADKKTTAPSSAPPLAATPGGSGAITSSPQAQREPAAPQTAPAVRQFEPVKPLEQGTEVIRELEIK